MKVVVGRRRTVRRDDRRAVVAGAELHADRGELLAHGRKMRADLRAARLRLPVYRPPSQVAPACARDACSVRAPRWCCARRSACARSRRIAAGPAPPQPLHQRCELPGEVGGIVHAGVHAEAAGRREQMRGIAGERHAAGGESLGHERDAGGPRPMAEDADWKVGADARAVSARTCLRRVGGAPSSDPLENTRNSSVIVESDEVSAPLGLTIQ